MSNADRRKWNERYSRSDCPDHGQPSALLTEWVPNLPEGGRALDVACGAGGNAMYLAAAGYRVDAVDIAAEGLALGAARAESLNLQVNWIEHDLEKGLAMRDAYELIVMIRYVNLPLLADLGRHLSPGGHLLVEQHLLTDAEVAGPVNPLFRVAPGELAASVGGLDIVFQDEGLDTGAGGALVASARLVARKPGTKRA